MVQNRYSSPISASYSDEVADSITELQLSWWWPENQLGLELGERFDSRRDDKEVALDKEGEIKHHKQL